MKRLIGLALIQLVLVGSLILAYKMAYAESVLAVPDWNRLASAIHITENGHSLDKGEQYGIHSVHYSSTKEAREICIRTCKHAWKDHKGDYLTFLAKRYCPVNWSNWLRIVKFYYKLLQCVDNNTNMVFTFKGNNE